MSNLLIAMNAVVTRAAFAGSGSVIISWSRSGTTCQDRPYLSLSQPHGPGSPPFSVSLFQ